MKQNKFFLKSVCSLSILLFSLFVFSFSVSAVGTQSSYKEREKLAPVLGRSIDSLNLSTRTKNVLKSENIYTIGDLVIKTERELLQILYFGEQNLAEVKTALARTARVNRVRLRLGMSVDWLSDSNPEEETVKELNDKLIEYKENMLTLREVQILRMRFGIGESRRTLAAVGKVFNVSGSRVHRIKIRALEKLHRFGYLTGKIQSVDRASDLTLEQVETLIREFDPAMLADNNILTSKEEKILRMRFGIGESRRILKKVGQVLNLSVVGVHKIQMKALQKLHHFGSSLEILQNMDSVSDLTSEQVERLLKAAKEWNSISAKLTPVLIHPIESTESQYSLSDRCSSTWNRGLTFN